MGWTWVDGKLYASNYQNVGIGTTNPQAPLHIGGLGVSTGILSRSFFGVGSPSLILNSGSTSNILARADGWFWSNGGGFVVTSDKRIKNIIGTSSGKHDLEMLSKIKITDYTYIDKVSNASKPQKKVIAQQLEEVFPDAVNQNAGIIPNVYEVAKKTEIIGASTIITTIKRHDFKTGDEVKLILKKGLEKITNVTVLDDHRFSIAEAIDDNIFVYGKKVNDLLSVDYDEVSMLNVSATQELYKLILDLKKENENKNTEFENRLKAIEGRLNILTNTEFISRN